MVYTILPIIYDVAIKNNISVRSVRWPPFHWRSDGDLSPARSRWAVVSLVAMLGNFTFNGKHRSFSIQVGDNHSSTLLGILATWYLQLVPRQRPQDEAFQAFIGATGEPPLRLWRYGDAAGQKLPTSNWIAMWDFSGLYRRGGAAWRFF